MTSSPPWSASALGAAVAYGMVLAMAKAFGAEDSNAGFQISYAVSARSLVIAFASGVLLTMAVVAFSAWRVSMMTISAAIRNLPEPPRVRERRRVLLGGLGVLLGLLMVALAGSAATPIMLGVSLILMSIVPLLRRIGVPERLAFTGCGLVMVVVLMLPWSAWEAVFGSLDMDFTTWIVAGLMIVVGDRVGDHVQRRRAARPGAAHSRPASRAGAGAESHSPTRSRADFAPG